MIIYPAIDLRGGKVVRLKEGDPDRQTVFSDDPLQTAQQWIDLGAQWLHMVNLDGAFAQANDNSSILEQAAQLGTPVQFGGGLRTMADIEQAFEQGAARVVLGGAITLKHPEIVREAVIRWGPDSICVALDTRDGKVTTHGWQQTSEITPTELGQSMAALGVRHALFTDVSRDGHLSGVNIEATAALGRATGLQVIASGGVSSAAEITQLRNTGAVAGVVIGMALYAGRITLPEAIRAAGGANADETNYSLS